MADHEAAPGFDVARATKVRVKLNGAAASGVYSNQSSSSHRGMMRVTLRAMPDGQR